MYELFLRKDAIIQRAIYSELHKHGNKGIINEDLIYNIWGINDEGSRENMKKRIQLLRKTIKRAKIPEKIIAFYESGKYKYALVPLDAIGD